MTTMKDDRKKLLNLLLNNILTELEHIEWNIIMIDDVESIIHNVIEQITIIRRNIE